MQGIFQDITERKQQEEKIQLQLNHLNALREIDQAITSSASIEMSLNIVMQKLISLLSIDAATILLVDPAASSLRMAVGHGFRTCEVFTASVKIEESYAGRAILEGRIIYIPNLANEPNNLFRMGLLKDDDFVSYYGVPLVAKGKSVGVMEVFHRTLVEREQEWFDFLETLAGQAAIAIDSTQSFDGLQRANLELSLAYDATIEGRSRAMDLRDKETEGHTQRVTELTVKMARTMGMSQDEIINLRRGALLHDMGKLGVPDDILLKPGKLTGEEWVIMKSHPNFAYEMLSPIAYLRPALDIPHCHHEKWDGSGYPRGLKGEQIPLAARIFSVIDVWDALTSDRPYRKAWPKEKTIEHIKEGSGKHFDPQIVDIFCKDDWARLN